MCRKWLRLQQRQVTSATVACAVGFEKKPDVAVANSKVIVEVPEPNSRGDRRQFQKAQARICGLIK